VSGVSLDTASSGLVLVVSYDGTDFHGFAENVGVRTVGGVLRSAVQAVLGRPVEITCAGRTDAGVHAAGQVVSVRWDELTGSDSGRAGSGPVDTERLRKSLISMLGPEVVVRSVAVPPEGFDARFSAVGRTYRYVLWNHADPDPFEARTAWWVPEPLDVEAMQAAGDSLVGEHDFTTFCRRPKGEAEVSLIRRVEYVRWIRPDWMSNHPDHEPGADGADQVPSGRLIMEISASAFCHQMVRSIVGLLVEVGRGRRTVDDVANALRARDRSHLPTLAPPSGLTLWRVHYA
jgi:tRNA pseudouridine38-40 synthase